MRDERGFTLVELLAAIVIAGVIIVPLLTIMTGTFTRTMNQDKETNISYVAQEVVEKVLNHRTPLERGSYCFSNMVDVCDGLAISGLEALPSPYNEINTTEDIVVLVEVKAFDPDADISDYNEVFVTVTNEGYIVNGPSGGVIEKENIVELVTVVRDENG
ncbi:type II secretion system protein [Halalkalibacter akibai]|uniref:Prepilin-type N-terminal cleavage/methylation domain-containing protein n=1 Tax=Halalkalibacter akibai (strain ATCC 43226 / DSM 21942 / CIP 109018 / JCM 9157 / 1139) TaxID=1236973 RepID=W4QS64_HALA3|nr:type II secretion system protein [Halalkalibacter akibai]GAE34945.1 hypothetical protein JCM9157_2030 [Halalkalibacter akibai JCM 9157]